MAIFPLLVGVFLLLAGIMTLFSKREIWSGSQSMNYPALIILVNTIKALSGNQNINAQGRILTLKERRVYGIFFLLSGLVLLVISMYV